jgi:carbon monoxide dehydrogenase subunit G
VHARLAGVFDASLRIAAIPVLGRVGAMALAALALGATLLGAPAAASEDPDIDVNVLVQGPEVTVDVNFLVPATQQEVWAVLTDYDNASRFITNLEKSAILSRSTDMMVVSQKGTVSLGPFVVTVDSVSEIRLKPPETMQSRMLSGSMKSHAATTRLSAEAGGTRIVHRARSNPDVWIPPVIGSAMIRHEAQLRFRQLYDEILRRKTGAGPAPRAPAAGSSSPPSFAR